MPVEVVLLALSAGMETGVIARWLKAEGDAVRKGDLLAEIETDKATMELEAQADGRIGRILVEGGGSAEVNQVIALLLKDGEEAFVPASPSPAGEARHKASPLARRLAAERGVSLMGMAGSGPKGRIVRIDVERAGNRTAPVLPAAPVAPAEPAGVPPGIGPYEAVPHTAMRRAIARRLSQAKQTVPHFYLTADCDIDALLALRARINETRAGQERISVNDFIVKASSVALRLVPEANAVWTEEAILRLRDVDIAVAVATEGGLITPLVRQADTKSLGTISAEIRALAARARENRLRPEEYQGGGFSVSNLGMHGVRSFAAIVNPPQSAILAVGAGERRPVERDGGLAFATMMSVTLSLDHRSVDGALGARLLAAFKAAVEAPMSLLV